jgi:hypothetical protein
MPGKRDVASVKEHWKSSGTKAITSV